MDTVFYAESILAFEKKKFEDALKSLSQIQMSNTVMDAQINCMKLQCYYELQINIPFYHLINSSKQYLLNHKNDISKGQLLMFRNFVSDINEITKLRRDSKLRSKINKSKIAKMLERLYEIINAPYTEWLIEKINEITNDSSNKNKTSIP